MGKFLVYERVLLTVDERYLGRYYQELFIGYVEEGVLGVSTS